MVLESCPFCHRPFAAEQVGRKEIDSNTEDLLKPPPTTVSSMGGLYTPSPDPTPVEIFTTYEIVYRCKHCGREWTGTHTGEKDLPRSEVGPEQASSEDVEMEEQHAKEEEYQREQEGY